MADLHRTIDRSIKISRSVADLLQRRVRTANERFSERMRGAYAQKADVSGVPRTPLRVLAAVGRVHDRRRAALGALLGHAAPARQPVARARGGRQAAGPQVQVRDDRRRPRTTSGRPTTRWCGSSRRKGVASTTAQASVRDRRSARGARPRHRRLQGGLGSRRRAVGRPSGVLRDLLPGPDAGPDARRRHRRRSRVHPHRRRAPSAQPEARHRRQLPGRLGGDDARRRASRHRGSARHQRRADVVLVRQRRRLADALHGRPAGRRVAVAVRRGPGRRQVRRRAPRAQLREPESRQLAVGRSGTTCTRTSTTSPSASSSSSAGGAASTSSTRRRSAGSSTTSSSATSSRRARRGSARAATST